MQSTLLLEGSGVCFPRKCLNFRPSEFASGGFRRSVANDVVIINKGKHLLVITAVMIAYEVLRMEEVGTCRAGGKEFWRMGGTCCAGGKYHAGYPFPSLYENLLDRLMDKNTHAQVTETNMSSRPVEKF